VRFYEAWPGVVHFDIEREEVVAIVNVLAKSSTLILDTPPVPLTVLKKGKYRIQVGVDRNAEVFTDEGELQFPDSRKRIVKLRKSERALLSLRPRRPPSLMIRLRASIHS
jgi:hypothetical protein